MLLAQPASHGNTALAPMPCYEAELQPSAQPSAEIVPLMQGCTILELTERKCKWPIGDPSTDGFTFCGRRSSQEGPYCVEHARVAYQPAVGKKKSSPNELARSLRRYI